MKSVYIRLWKPERENIQNKHYRMQYEIRLKSISTRRRTKQFKFGGLSVFVEEDAKIKQKMLSLRSSEVSCKRYECSYQEEPRDLNFKNKRAILQKKTFKDALDKNFLVNSIQKSTEPLLRTLTGYAVAGFEGLLFYFVVKVIECTSVFELQNFNLSTNGLAIY